MNEYEVIGFLKEAILSPGLSSARKGGRDALRGAVGSIDRALRRPGAMIGNLAMDNVSARMARVVRRGGSAATALNERIKQMKVLELKNNDAWLRERGMK